MENNSRDKRNKEDKKSVVNTQSAIAVRSAYVIFWLTLSVLFVVFFAAIVGREISRYNEYVQTADELRTRIYEEERRAHQLNAEIHRDNLYEYIERSARERLGFVMPDEIIFIRE